MLSIKYVQYLFTVIHFMFVKNGLIHPKMIIVSFTHLRVIPNLHFFSEAYT